MATDYKFEGWVGEDAASTTMPLDDYLGLVAADGTLVQVGLPEGAVPLRMRSVAGTRRRLAGSAIGSPAEMRDMFQPAADSKMAPWVETRPMEDANQAMVDMAAAKPRFRYVLVNPEPAS